MGNASLSLRIVKTNANQKIKFCPDGRSVYNHVECQQDCKDWQYRCDDGRCIEPFETCPVQVIGQEYVEKGESVELICNATGKPDRPHDVKWYKDGNSIQSDAHRGILIRKKIETKVLISVLVIKKSKISDGGVYICRSSNRNWGKIEVHILSEDCKDWQYRCDDGRCIEPFETCRSELSGGCEEYEKKCWDGRCIHMDANCDCDGLNEIMCSSGRCVDRHSEDDCDPPNHAQPFYYVLVGVAVIVVILIIVCKRRCAKKQQGTTARAAYSAQTGQEGQPLNTVNLDFSGTRMQPVTNVNNTTNNQTNSYGPTIAGANPYPPPMNRGAAPPYPPVSTGAPAYPPAFAGGPTYPTGPPAYPPASAGGPTYPTGAPAYPPASAGGPTYPTEAPAYPPASTGGPPNPSAPPAEGYHYTPPADLPPPPCYDDAVTTKT